MPEHEPYPPGVQGAHGHTAPAHHAPVDRIRLVGITAFGYHGVLESERRSGQTFSADVVLHVDTRPAAATDRLDLTVDYGGLAEQVAAVLAGDPADLIETVAERIAVVALSYAPVAAVDVVLHKPQAPITVPFGDVTVEIHRDRRHLPSLVAVPLVDPAAGGDPAPATAQPAPAPTQPALASAQPPGPATATAPATVPVASAVPLASAVAAPAPVAVPALEAMPVADGDTTRLDLPVPALEPWPTADLDATRIDPPAAPAPPEPPLPSAAFDDPEPLVDPLDAVPPEPVDVVLALGSNLGGSQETLRQAVSDLAAVPGLEITAIAPLARTGPVGGPEQPDYLNTVLLARTVLSPRALLAACQGVEARHGRVREERWAARTLDIDLIVHGSTLAVAEDLELPHPRAHQRAFVLEPWAQVAPDAVLPGLGGGPVGALARTAPDRDGIRWLALDWWSPQPERG